MLRLRENAVDVVAAAVELAAPAVGPVRGAEAGQHLLRRTGNGNHMPMAYGFYAGSTNAATDPRL